jgi:coenzyme F420-reducing hydrogenase beta subunit
MSTDVCGFKYPEVNYEKCIKCEQCIKVCPSINSIDLSEQIKNPKVYAAWSNNNETRLSSTSGGIFTELSKKIIENNGVVVGARYSDNHFVKHEMVKKSHELHILKQSKYVQSDIGSIFKHIREELNNKVVSFTGTPCQVAGLKNFIGNQNDNLITFDFVCRGVNSPKAYRKYLDMLEAKYGSKIKKIEFKNKTYGWNRFSTKVDFENGKIYLKDRYSDVYMRGYIEENLYMRPCCFECKYKTFPRVSDITLADFWGVAAVDAHLDDNRGTSLIMINSIKGEKIFSQIQLEIYSKEVQLENALSGNNAIFKSANKNLNSKEFLSMLDNASFLECFRKYVSHNYIKRLFLKIMVRFSETKFFYLVRKIKRKLVNKR